MNESDGRQREPRAERAACRQFVSRSFRFDAEEMDLSKLFFYIFLRRTTKTEKCLIENEKRIFTEILMKRKLVSAESLNND